MMTKTTITLISLALSLSVFSGCGSENNPTPTQTPAAASSAASSPTEASPPAKVDPPAAGTKQPSADAGTGVPAPQAGNPSGAKTGNPVGAQAVNQTGAQAAVPNGTSSNSDSGSAGKKTEPTTPPRTAAIQVVAKPESITALVNKQYALPESYEPQDLVYPNVPFIFSEKVDKRKMRKEAAAALEQLFEGAKKDGISLAGVSAYRSYATQKTLYNNYVKQDGEEKAKMYSALPGHSEHETGLAIDVSGSSGKCAAQDCFAATKEARWLDQHASEFGFIIRYPQGKASITGYQYEPWHLRYLGTKLAKEVAEKDVTLEEYFNAVPVTK
jgi:D-alanyl-D-alanine carboxypeptidase